MSLIKRQPKSITPFSLFDTDFDQLLPGFFKPLTQSDLSQAKMPAVNLDEKDDRYELTADLPGFDKQDIDVKIKDGVLTISAEHNEESKKEEQGNILNERRHQSYYRSFNFSNNVAQNDITAAYNNGVLSLTLPKLKIETSEHTKIDIN